MKKNQKEFTVSIPAELEKDFRLFVVLHGGAILEPQRNTSEGEKES